MSSPCSSCSCANSNVAEVYVGYLRRKFGADLITTVRGMGYRLQPPAA